MTKIEAIATLKEAQAVCGRGYAHDIISGLLADDSPQLPAMKRRRGQVAEEPVFTDQDADSLFRTLVLDEGFALDSATETYTAATILIAVRS